jgi:hypothetical protein
MRIAFKGVLPPSDRSNAPQNPVIAEAMFQADMAKALSGKVVLTNGVKAAEEMTASPTPRQSEAGNYRKGVVVLHGLEIHIETPAGEIRRGIGHDGREWEHRLKHTYGYIKRAR